MKILRFEILDEDDVVEKVENNHIHVRKKNGAYIVYQLVLNEADQVVDFNVLCVMKGAGFIHAIDDADIEDLAEVIGDTYE